MWSTSDWLVLMCGVRQLIRLIKNVSKIYILPWIVSSKISYTKFLRLKRQLRKFRKIEIRRISVLEIFGLWTKMKLMKETIIWDDSVGLFYLNIAHRLNNKISHSDFRHWGFPCPENTRSLDSEGRFQSTSNFPLWSSGIFGFSCSIATNEVENYAAGSYLRHPLVICIARTIATPMKFILRLSVDETLRHSKS